MSYARRYLMLGATALVLGSIFLLAWANPPIGLGLALGAILSGAWLLRPWSREAREVRAENRAFMKTLDDAHAALAAFDARHADDANTKVTR